MPESIRLRTVIDALYKPSPSIARQVFALSRRDVESLPRLATMAVISITSPGREEASIDGFTHVLRLVFSDVNFLSPDISERARLRLASAFTPDQAAAIHRFIGSLPADVKSLVVHCEGGYSRSCAIALATHKTYGYSTDLSRLRQANPSIVQLMMLAR